MIAFQRPTRRTLMAADRPAPHLRRTRQMDLYRRALDIMPGGTGSNLRAWGDDPIYVHRGPGGMGWDGGGNEDGDLRVGYGPGRPRPGHEAPDDNRKKPRGAGVRL